VRNYEGVFIFRTEADVIARGKEAVKAEFAKIGAEIVKEEDMGERNLCYPIKKQERAHYFVYHLKISPEKIIQVEKILHLTPDVLRFMFVRKDD